MRFSPVRPPPVGRGLSRSILVTAALAVLDEFGFDGLTVRAVAARLHVKAPALYWHVRNKQDLLDEMATEIWRRVGAELDALPDGLTWQQHMLAFAAITRRMLLAHRDGARVFSGTYLTDVSVLQRQEAALARMRAEGFAVADVVRGFALLYNFTIGFCIEEQAVAQTTAAGDERYSMQARAGRLDASAYPLVIESGPHLFGDPDVRFADLVAVIIEAIERMRGPR
jgi:TetR/AcrR family transcriptional regulator, tetracycline repressor protein